MRSIKTSKLKISIHCLILSALILSIPSKSWAKIYKWTDASGNTHYTATPPPTKIKAKTEEFKVQKVKKSSLTFTGDEYASSSNIKRTNKSSSPKSVKRSPKSQCRNALRKIPAMNSSLKIKLRQAKARGKVSDEQFRKAMAGLEKTKSNPQSMSDCVEDYKSGGTKQNDVDLVANNNAEDALSYVMLNAAFEQAAKDQFKKSKKK